MKGDYDNDKAIKPSNHQTIKHSLTAFVLGTSLALSTAIIPSHHAYGASVASYKNPHDALENAKKTGTLVLDNHVASEPLKSWLEEKFFFAKSLRDNPEKMKEERKKQDEAQRAIKHISWKQTDGHQKNALAFDDIIFIQDFMIGMQHSESIDLSGQKALFPKQEITKYKTYNVGLAKIIEIMEHHNRGLGKVVISYPTSLYQKHKNGRLKHPNIQADFQDNGSDDYGILTLTK